MCFSPFARVRDICIFLRRESALPSTVLAASRAVKETEAIRQRRVTAEVSPLRGLR
jgi:hypothetical protein